LITPTFLLAVLLLGLSTCLARSGYLWMQPGYVPFTHNPGHLPGHARPPGAPHLTFGQAGPERARRDKRVSSRVPWCTFHTDARERQPTSRLDPAILDRMKGRYF
jgi:hypothetical protein